VGRRWGGVTSLERGFYLQSFYFQALYFQSKEKHDEQRVRCHEPPQFFHPIR